MMSFKIGDRVRYISRAYHSVPIGTTGKVIGLRKEVAACSVRWDTIIFPGCNYNVCFNSSLELVNTNPQLMFDFMYKQ